MKKIFVLMPALAIVLFITFKFVDIYEQLAITKEKAKERMLESIAYGLVVRGDQNELVSNARKLPVELRVIGIRELIQHAKEYSTTPEFASEYKTWRKNQLNPNQKTKLGLPRLGKIIENKVSNKVSKADNEKKFPEDPNELIKTRLTEFIALVPTVDFEAEIDDNQFVNPEYQKKDYQWKMCFRAGKEVVEAALVEAKKWLAELK